MVFGKNGFVGKNAVSRVVVATNHATGTVQGHISMDKTVLDPGIKLEIVILLNVLVWFTNSNYFLSNICGQRFVPDCMSAKQSLRSAWVIALHSMGSQTSNRFLDRRQRFWLEYVDA